MVSKGMLVMMCVFALNTAEECQNAEDAISLLQVQAMDHKGRKSLPAQVAQAAQAVQVAVNGPGLEWLPTCLQPRTWATCTRPSPHTGYDFSNATETLTVLGFSVIGVTCDTENGYTGSVQTPEVCTSLGTAYSLTGCHLQGDNVTDSDAQNWWPLALARLAGTVYGVDPIGVATSLDGWDRKVLVNPASHVRWGGDDHIAIFGKNDMCAIVFTGSNDLTDWVHNCDINEVSHCGTTLHHGFFREFMGITQNISWTNDVMPVLKSECQGGIIAVGHSLGGALANIFAGCANTKPTDEPPPFNGSLNGITVQQLYTYGAPGVSKTRLENDNSTTKTFQGGRFYEVNSFTFDLVPFLASRAEYLHPMVDAYRLSSNLVEEMSFTKHMANDNPSDILTGFPTVEAHHVRSHVSRLEAFNKGLEDGDYNYYE